MRLKGKVSIVNGGIQSIDEATVKKLGEHGLLYALSQDTVMNEIVKNLKLSEK